MVDEQALTGEDVADVERWVVARREAEKAEQERLAAIKQKADDELAAHKARVQAVIDKGVMELGTLAFNHRARTREFEAARDKLVDQIGVLARSIQ